LSSSDYSSGFSNVTSSPLISPSSPSQCSNTSNLWSSASNTTATTSSELANSTFNSSKKRVLFADDAGKELFTVRTMSEPSNCPPKLTSKIVQYFLNREFSHQNAQCGSGMNNKQVGTENYNNYASLSGHQLLNNQFFSTTRSYDYGISALNYTNDVNKVSGSLAVYSLNFQQPAGDYLKFRQRIEQKYVSLENVLLNGFQVNGTIRVKNIEFHKNVFIRCSFNKWASFEDYQAVYVPCDYFSSVSSLSPTMSSSSISASFCGQYQQPVHKEYDTFRFEFQLPKTVDKSKFQSESENNCDRHATASIQFCICYQSGTVYDLKEFWDSNEGNNYEILQYVIDLENLKPKKHVSIASAASAASSQLKNNNKSKSNHFKYIESNLSSNNKSFNSFHETSVYY
jgi:protein phosphatase 1 regulatory subunit 3A/B/C/D/E